jgi:hypothetical protein
MLKKYGDGVFDSIDNFGLCCSTHSTAPSGSKRNLLRQPIYQLLIDCNTKWLNKIARTLPDTRSGNANLGDQNPLQHFMKKAVLNELLLNVDAR